MTNNLILCLLKKNAGASDESRDIKSTSRFSVLLTRKTCKLLFFYLRWFIFLVSRMFVEMYWFFFPRVFTIYNWIVMFGDDVCIFSRPKLGSKESLRAIGLSKWTEALSSHRRTPISSRVSLWTRKLRVYELWSSRRDEWILDTCRERSSWRAFAKWPLIEASVNKGLPGLSNLSSV